MKWFIAWPAFWMIAFSCFLSSAQPSDYPFSSQVYPFIRYDLNHIDTYGDKQSFDAFLEKLDTVIFKGTGSVNIVHLGGSHVQAGTFPREVMSRFQSVQAGLSLGAFYFPYNLAGTNNPRGYLCTGWGYWSTCKNTDASRLCNLGVSGISLSTTDTLAGFQISPNPEIEKGDRIILLYDDESSYDLVCTDSNNWFPEEKGPGYLKLRALTDSSKLSFQIRQCDTLGKAFTFHGLATIPGEAGVNYYSFGINGAHLASFYNCELLGEHLKQLRPDLVILSIGINDAHGKRFSPSKFQNNYEVLIQQIRTAVPGVAILLTTNTDSYINRRYLNRNALLVGETMTLLSETQACAVWDWFGVMGGLNSIRQWQSAGLAGNDRVHLTREGYSLSGDLLFEAILLSYEQYLNRIPDSDD